MIRIVTDTSCDLPDALLSEHGIVAVPLTIRFGDEGLVDRRDITPAAFWERLTGGDVLPETAAPPPGRFAAAFEDLAGGGATGIVAVCISSKLSGTLDSARLAAENAPVPVHLVDSGLTSGALGLVALQAARTAADGGNATAVIAAAESAAAATNVIGALDTLEFLKRGGRIGQAQAFFGTLLDIKPLIAIEEGVVAPAGRVRTRRKALRAVLDRAVELRGRLAEVVVVHGAAADLDGFLVELAEVHPPADTIVTQLGPVVGTHAGPGLIGLCYRLGPPGLAE